MMESLFEGWVRILLFLLFYSLLVVECFKCEVEDNGIKSMVDYLENIFGLVGCVDVVYDSVSGSDVFFFCWLWI